MNAPSSAGGVGEAVEPGLVVVEHRVRELASQVRGGTADLGLLREYAVAAAREVLDVPGVQDVEPLVEGAVVPGGPGQAPGAGAWKSTTGAASRTCRG